MYRFGIYSPQLKDGPAGLAQKQLDWVSFAGNVGNYTPLPGLFYDAFGPKASIIGAPFSVCHAPLTPAPAHAPSTQPSPTNGTIPVSAILIGSGYFLLYLVAGGTITSSAYALSVVACFLWGMGAGGLDNTCVSTSIRNFPKERGAIVGLTKSM